MTRIRPLLLLCLSISFGHVTAAETKPPAGHFDLSHWKLTLPVSASGTAVGKAMEIPATKLSAGYTDAQCFHTGTNGEMVFWCPVTGATTEGSEYPRTELREVNRPDRRCRLLGRSRNARSRRPVPGVRGSQFAEGHYRPDPRLLRQGQAVD